MADELVATYFYADLKLDVYACRHPENKSDEIDCFDVYDGDTCMNEGNPLFTMPTRKRCGLFLENPNG